MPTLWIVHREPDRRAALARLSGAGEDTILGDPRDRLFEGSPPADVVLLGLSGDLEEELEFAHRFAPRLAGARWLLLAEPSDAGDARRLFDTLDAEVIVWPPSPERLRERLRSSVSRRAAEPLSDRRSRDAVAARFARWFAGIEIPEMLRALDPRLARACVLISGETGSGRTLLGRYLHAFGGSTGGALVQVACHEALGVANLVASIRDAARDERSRRSVTVLLEDVDRLAPAVQRELRGFVELDSLPAVAHSAWVRFIATLEECPGGSERPLDPGLRQALAALPIRLPPLRESPERIAILVEETTAAFCEANGSRPRRFSAEALEALRSHPWPGNLRELEAVVLRTLAASAAEVVPTSALRFDGEPLFAPAAKPPPPPRERSEPPVAAPGPSEDHFVDETWRLMEPDTPPARGDDAHAPPAAAPSVATHRAEPVSAARRGAPAELVGDQGLRRLLAAISHELGNATVPLRAAAGLLAERFEDPAFRERFAALVDTDSRRVQSVLGRLATFAAFGAPARNPIDLAALLDPLLGERESELRERQVLLLRELERAKPCVLGDALQLRFALEGLIGKAIELVKPRGDLYLASRHHPHGLRGAPSIRVLLRFHAASRITPSGASEGVSLSETALDLLLTEAVVRAHGGRFALDSGESSETVVLIDLPAPDVQD
ncbi:DNA-binding transcriptional regulator NtrC [Myxococcaceae bacterium]|jgi:DNA-binding NtrC family response regulator/signal transduction histidine kinase|nr:DNA-binding transcriptional regulator NtrC [Myxococcaceae bacterium]